MALTDILDSYYMQIKSAMATVDSSQVFGGSVDARDWPATPITTGALYLLFLQAAPSGGTEAQRQFHFYCQWNWIIIGTDIQAGQQAANRGDRRRVSLQIMANLRQASYPGFCQKKSYSANSQGIVSSSPVQSALPFSSVESITWSAPRMMPKLKEEPGIVYGAAAVDIYGYDDVLAVIA